MASRVGTYNLSAESLTISSSDSVTYLSVNCVSGTVTFLGNDNIIPILGTNDAFTMTVGSPINIFGTTNIQFLDGIVIDATLGEAQILVA